MVEGSSHRLPFCDSPSHTSCLYQLCFHASFSGKICVEINMTLRQMIVAHANIYECFQYAISVLSTLHSCNMFNADKGSANELLRSYHLFGEEIGTQKSLYYYMFMLLIFYRGTFKFITWQHRNGSERQ